MATNNSSSEQDSLAALVAALNSGGGGGGGTGNGLEGILAGLSGTTASTTNNASASSQLADLQALRLRVLLGGANGGGIPHFLAPPPPPSLAQQLLEIETMRRRADLIASSQQQLLRSGNSLTSSSMPGGISAETLALAMAARNSETPASLNASSMFQGLGAGSGLGSSTSSMMHAAQVRSFLQGLDSSTGANRFQGDPVAQRPDSSGTTGCAAATQRQHGSGRDSPLHPNRVLQLPPVEEGETPHFSKRLIVPLGIEEDANFLSERQVFIRSELLEVVRASHEEVLVRSSSKSIAYQQVGIRCRYCAHLQPGSRAIRASAFPSSIPQMYQSFTMMVRDHFGSCVGVPPEKKERFLQLKGLTSPSSSLSRQYWTYAAKKLGMVDSELGIIINMDSQAEALKMPPFGTTPEETAFIKEAPMESLVEAGDMECISPYLHTLMTHTQVVHLLPSERVGKRKDAAVGLPGFGCQYCVKAGRLGFCRMFPLNKRSLPDKVNDLFNHMVRCPQCPKATKRLLESRRAETAGNRNYAERDREFIDRIWHKLGRDGDEAFKKP